MADITPEDIDLETFLKSAGQSFTDAQKSLVSGMDVPVNMMLSTAELELKVAVSSNASGKMSIRPISSEDITRGGIDSGMLSTIRINFVSSIGEIRAESKPAPSGDATAAGSAVPDVVGLTIDAAAALLKSRGWEFEAHAASAEELSAAGKESRGRVLRQQPAGSRPADKKTTVQLWVNLGSASVTEIEGIGAKFEEGLSKAGIGSVGELSLANAARVASALRISESRAQVLIDQAGLISRLAILGFRDEVVELLAKGASISSVEQLADADPTQLLKVSQEAVASGKVRVPRGFTFTADDVKGWIKAAKSYVGR